MILFFSCIFYSFLFYRNTDMFISTEPTTNTPLQFKTPLEELAALTQEIPEYSEITPDTIPVSPQLSQPTQQLFLDEIAEGEVEQERNAEQEGEGDSPMIDSSASTKTDTTLQEPKEPTKPKLPTKRRGLPTLCESVQVYRLGKDCFCKVFLIPHTATLIKEFTSMNLSPAAILRIKSLDNSIRGAIKSFTEGKDVNLFSHLGDNIYVSVHNPYACVDIRKFHGNSYSDNVVPSKHGICITFWEYYQLADLLKKF